MMKLFPPSDESIESLGRSVRAGRRTFVDILKSCLDRIDEWEPRVHAWVVVDREAALRRARECDEQLRAGHDLGPMHGIPVGVKDIIDVAGMPTAAGALRWATGPAAEDAPIVARLRRAGALILGKTVTTAYAWVDPPPTRNPWNLDRTPGGSSSGSAAAVSLGMCLAALGTQTGGSLTRPASYCGVSCFKPPDGTGLSKGIVPLARSLDTPGIMARRVGDLRLAWDVLAPPGGNPDRGEAKSITFGGNRPVIGRLRGFFDEKAEPAMRVAFEASLADLAASGAKVVEAVMPASFAGVHRAHRVVMAAEGAAFHSGRLARLPEDYGPKIRSLIEEGLALPAVDYVRALDARREAEGAVEAMFGDYHAIAIPATTGPAPDRSTTGESTFNAPWTFTRSPTVSFPIGASADGLPMAIQLVGPRSDLNSLLRVASWCEQVIRSKRA